MHVVAEATDAATAVEVCTELQPRCVVVGLGDAPPAVATIRAACPAVAIVLVVTPAAADAAVAGLRAGARGFLNREALAQAPAVVRAVTGGVVALPPLLAAALLDGGAPTGGPPLELSGPERDVLRHLAGGRSYGAAADAVGVTEERAKTLVAAVVDRFQESVRAPGGRG